MPETEALIRAKLRTPQQGRSKASFERMLEAAEQLMTERGSDEFTLNEVAKSGKVSIGSIYCRFESKEDLIHAVQLRVLERVDAGMRETIDNVRKGKIDLTRCVQALVDELAEAFRRYADILRPFMLRASSDPLVAALGKRSYQQTAQAFQDVLLEHRAEIRHADPDHAVDTSYRMLYASIARYLGFGSSIDAAGEGDWTALKRDLADIIVAYLSFVPSSRRTPG